MLNRSPRRLSPKLPPLLRRPEADLARRAIGLDLRAINILEGVRAALSVALLVALNEWLRWPPMMMAALGAWLACLCDQGGPIRRRLPAVLSFTVVGALITGGAGLARSGGLAGAVPVASLGMFCLSFARVYGQSALVVGNLLGVMLVLALDQPLPDLGTAAVLAGAFAGGGLWATLLTMLVWRIHPYEPARRAVAEVYRQLSLMVGTMRELVPGKSPQAAWEAHARAHRRSVREAIEAARTTVLDTVRVRGPVSPRAAQSLIRLEAGDQLFGVLIAFSDVFEQAAFGEGVKQAAVGGGLEQAAFGGGVQQPPDAKFAARELRLLGGLLLTLSRNIATQRTTSNPAIARAIDRLARHAASLPPGHALSPILEAMVERLRIAAMLSVPADFLPGAIQGGEALPWRERVRRPLLANLNWNSLALRHSLRTAIVVAPAIAITLIWYGPYEHWLTITLVLTMQPYVAMTITRALERIGGTVLGGIVAALLGLVCRTPVATAAALFPLAVIALAVRQVSFGLFMMAVTPIVVLLSEIGRPGSSEWVLAGMRCLYTVIGGVLGLVGCLVLWPSWEPDRLAKEIRAAIAAHGRYAEAEMSHVVGEATVDAVEAARRAAGVASNNLEASLSRALQEPRHLSREGLQAALAIDAALRRLAGRLSAMQFTPGLREGLPDAAWQEWRDWIAGTLADLAAGQAADTPRPPSVSAGPAAEMLSRMARQLDLIAGALRRVG